MHGVCIGRGWRGTAHISKETAVNSEGPVTRLGNTIYGGGDGGGGRHTRGATFPQTPTSQTPLVRRLLDRIKTPSEGDNSCCWLQQGRGALSNP